MLRIVFYVSCLRATGLAIFAMGFGRLQDEDDAAACRRLTLAMAAAGLVSSGFWLDTQVALASDGDLFDAEVWDMILTSRPGLSILVAWAGPQAAHIVESWARAASWIVGGVILSGVTMAWLLVGQLGLLVTTAYGLALLTKIVLVGVLLGYAAWHRFRLTPAMAAGAPGSGARLAVSIGWEAVVMVLVFWAVGEMASTSPRTDGL